MTEITLNLQNIEDVKKRPLFRGSVTGQGFQRLPHFRQWQRIFLEPMQPSRTPTTGIKKNPSNPQPKLKPRFAL